MKFIPYLIITGLVIVIMLMLFFKGSHKELGNIQAKYDSVLKPHITRIAQLKRHEDILKHDLSVTKKKGKSDSITYKRTISRLIKERDAARYAGIAHNVPDDSVQIAMDCLEKEPIKDSISAVRDNRITQLEGEKADLIKEYGAIMDDDQAEKNELQAEINIKDQEIKELTKQAKKANRKARLRLIEGVAIGVISGLGLGAVSQ